MTVETKKERGRKGRAIIYMFFRRDRFTLTCPDLSSGKGLLCVWGLQANMTFVFELNHRGGTFVKVKRT